MTMASISSSAPTDALLAAVKQIDAGDLDVGYVDVGPATGRAVLLLHGWPYDIHSFAEVIPILAEAGYRVVIPHLRGYGSTRFLSDDAVRNGQQAALAVDAVALMDALEIPNAIVGGFDWGARTAAIVAVLWPERCRLPESRPRRHRHPQLPVEDRRLRWRAPLRRPGSAIGSWSSDHRAHHHPGGRCERGATSGCRLVPCQVHRQV